MSKFFSVYLLVIGPMKGLAINCTTDFDANIIPTSTLSCISSRCARFLAPAKLSVHAELADFGEMPATSNVRLNSRSSSWSVNWREYDPLEKEAPRRPGTKECAAFRAGHWSSKCAAMFTDAGEETLNGEGDEEEEAKEDAVQFELSEVSRARAA